MRRFRSCLAVVLATILVSPGLTLAADEPQVFEGAIFYVPNGDGMLYAYQQPSWTLVGSWQMPFAGSIRGSDADAAGGYLYIAHGGDGGGHGTGSLLKWNLRTHAAEWDRAYPFGVDQFAYCSGRIYMPVGEASLGEKTWQILDAGNGDVIGSLIGGNRPHNTICHNGNVYLGGRAGKYLKTRGVTRASWTTAKNIGPTPSTNGGVRPFTVDANDTRVWITWTRYRGFSIANARTGSIVSSVNFGAIPSAFTGSAPSHGISLSPDGTEIYVLDTSMQQVQVYSSADSPQHLATISFGNPILAYNVPCYYDCQPEGWLLHSRNGRYVYVGESGDVIDTQTRTVTTNIPPLRNDRHGFIEVEWAGGEPIFTTSHFGIGR